MAKNEYKIIGLMSGTSLDGIDLVHAIIYPDKWKFEILHTLTVPYTKKWQEDLGSAIHLSKRQLLELDIDYTNFLADVISSFIAKFSIVNIDAVCSHGHTILHQPEKGLTYQIGNQKELATLIGQTVICDFRVQDVDYGGQGAPLVPMGDKLLFSDYDYCLNLGGFANISFDINGTRMAFDICPVNIVMNRYCKRIGLEYDDKGRLASDGSISNELLELLNALEFYTMLPPKSLGLEWVEKEIFPLIDSFDLGINDILRTFVEHVAIQISNQIQTQKRVLMTGGGVYNDFLISRTEELSGCMVMIPSKEIIEYKEALIFGLLGVLKMKNEINCLRSVTGASRDHSSGKIFLP